MEYLQPNKAPKESPKDRIWNITGENLYPWEDPEKLALQPTLEKRVWRSKVFAGLIDMKAVIADLCAALGVESEEEEFRAPEPAAMLALDVDAQGMVMSDVAVGSLVWAMGQIRNNAGVVLDPKQFQTFSEEVVRAVRELLVRRAALSPGFAESCELDPDLVSQHPLTHADILAIKDLVTTLAGYKPSYSVAARVHTRSVPVAAASEEADDEFLNSFVAPDLALIHEAIHRNEVGSGFEGYLHGTREPRLDVVQDREAAFRMVEPSKFPLGRWAAEHPLAFAQQAAVNAIFERLSDRGIFSVNGPPGTGKTTLLRDIVANIIVQRAEFLATLSDPNDAFTKQIKISGEKYGYWQLDPRLSDFGIVVASANNAAVENVTRELPGVSTISKGFLPVDHFADVADTLAAVEKGTRKAGASWGLISAVLGNKSNRSEFINRFWYSKPPDDRPLAEEDPVSIQMALNDMEGAVPTWEEAKRAFLEARDQARERILRTATVAKALRSHDKAESVQGAVAAALPGLQSAWKKACEDVEQAASDLSVHQAEENRLGVQVQCLDQRDAMKEALRNHLGNRPEGKEAELVVAMREAERTISRMKQGHQDAKRELEVHLSAKPGFLTNLLSFGSAEREWRGALPGLNEKIREGMATVFSAEDEQDRLRRQFDALRDWHAESERAQASVASADRALKELGLDPDHPCGVASAELAACQSRIGAGEKRLRQAELGKAHASAAFDQEEARGCEARREIAEALATITHHGCSLEDLAEWRQFQAPEKQLQLWAPWKDAETLDARAQVFLAALTLHRSFLVLARKRFDANMRRFVDLMQGTLAPGRFADGGGTLWNTFFLAVPLVSTTFASFGRLFSGLGRESLAWVLIDEAGQATPQLAAGAIWRARRAVVVGDPMQVEPVMTVPKAVVSALSTAWRVGSKWDPSLTSVQVLADDANPLGTWLHIDGKTEASHLTDRDLAEDENRIWVGSPLRVHRRCFDPMFRIANKIAYNGLMVFGTGGDNHEPWAGESCWVDVPSVLHDGHWVPDQGRRMLETAQAIAQLNGGLFHADGKANLYIISPYRKVADEARKLIASRFGWPVAKKLCGTVHTFQGKEADVVILLLGGDPTKPGSITTFVARKPNILNVAVTRAKKRLYVIGDHNHWAGHRYFDEMARSLPRLTVEQFEGRVEA